jgi:hypothetical protein
MPPAATLQSLGVPVLNGLPARPLPANIALGLFNPDPLLDVARYADGKIQVWQNLGDGMFELVGERRVASDVTRLEWRKERMWGENIPDQSSWGVLHVFYENGGTDVLMHEQFAGRPHAGSVPPSAMAPVIDFREVWRSAISSQPTRFMSLGDIDNDGKIEIVYPFYELFSDSVHFVVYECAGQDSFVVDWDTTLYRAYGPFGITDLDRNGLKELVLGRSVQGGGQVILLECLGPGRYQMYQTNILYQYSPFKAIEANVNHNGQSDLVWHTSNPSAPAGQDATFIFIAEFVFKSGTTMSFNIQLARYSPYTFDMAVGQIDGTGWDEIIPSGGSFGFHEPVPIEYLWYNGTTWVVRQIHTGLESGTTTEMFVNLDADTTKELFIGAVGPVGHGSCYALKYVSDTTWSVLWADSSLRNTPLSVNAGMIAGQFVVAGANTVDRGGLDTLYTDLHVYQPSGVRLGIWRRDSASVQNFHILDIDNNGTANLVSPIISQVSGTHHLAAYEYSGSLDVPEPPGPLPEGFALSQNYPNPFNPSTNVEFRVKNAGFVELRVYDVLGREVANLVNEKLGPGTYTRTWNAGGMPSGVYFCRLVAGTFIQTRKALLLR